MEHILILEDDENVLLPLADLLQATGYEVTTAENGREGIQLARSEKPDLIVSDIMMPEVDGYEVFKALQSEPETAIIPFIFLTAKSEPEEVREGMGLGADDYITKPFVPKELLAAIRARIDRYKRISEKATVEDRLNEQDQLFIKDGESCWFVEVEKLRLLESDESYVRLFFEDQQPLVSRTLNFMEQRLPSRMFFRANRKQIVNLRWIKNIQPWFNGGLLIVLKDGTRVQMSRRAAQSFKQKMGI